MRLLPHNYAQGRHCRCTCANCTCKFQRSRETLTGLFCDPASFSRSQLRLSKLTLGTLFLALDRFLVVTFPHNFQLHEKKLRIFKVILTLVAMFFYSLFTVGRLLEIQILISLASLNFLVFLLANIVLYVVIVVKIVQNERKMKAHRNTGNRYVFVLFTSPVHVYMYCNLPGKRHL